ncbi:MAG: helix-turn-helix domain-containing protein [Sphingomonas sp.]|uniref:helix-turn-helix domain-containing protein n=1 Tax=Sphingomonas sp. TaxID=28214 RepID=UPI001ACF3CC7|nr:helix-turn-helix domain-containing protein [Sphingomonas sp.]MBN8815212.1 helix-turn-helix domain-containing protein [Sphingomonas sp.]
MNRRKPRSARPGGEAAAQPLRPLCLTVDEAADALSVGRTKLYQLIAEGEIEAVKIGKSTRITTESLEALLKRGSQLPLGIQ